MRPFDAALLGQFRPFFEHLLLAVIAADPTETIRYANQTARNLFGQRPRGAVESLLGAELHDTLCVPILRGECEQSLWREVDLPIGTGLRALASGLRLDYPEGRGLLVLLVDVSAEVALEEHYRMSLKKQQRQNEELQREIAVKLREHEDDVSQFSEILQIAPPVFGSFSTEAGAALELLDRLVGKHDAKLEEVLRSVHTLKGNARSLGLNFIGGRAHFVEQLLQERTSATGREATSVNDRLVELIDDLKRALSRAHFLRVRLDAVALRATPGRQFEEAEQIERALVLVEQALEALEERESGESAAKPLATARQLLQQQARISVSSLFEYVRAAALLTARTNGVECDVKIADGSFTVPPSIYRALSVALPHLARNAVLHGLESPDERLAAGKPAAGTIEIEAERVSGALRVRLRDDGRGLDREALRARGEALGIPAGTEIGELLFHPSLSTASAASLDSGRGYGTSAAKAAVESLDGSISVQTSPGSGSEFLIEIPLAFPRARP